MTHLITPKKTDFIPKNYNDGHARYKAFAEAYERITYLLTYLFTETDLEFNIKSGVKDIIQNGYNSKEWNTFDREEKETAGIGVEIYNKNNEKQRIRVYFIIRGTNTDLLISRTIPSDLVYYNEYEALIGTKKYLESRPKDHIAIINCLDNKNNILQIQQFYIDSYPNIAQKYFKLSKIEKTKIGLFGKEQITYINKNGLRAKRNSGSKNGRYSEWFFTDLLTKKCLAKNKVNSYEEAKEKIINRLNQLIREYYIKNG